MCPVAVFNAAALNACIGHALMSRTSARRASLPFATRIIAVRRRREQLRPWASMRRGTFTTMINYLSSFPCSSQSNAEIYKVRAGGLELATLRQGCRKISRKIEFRATNQCLCVRFVQLILLVRIELANFSVWGADMIATRQWASLRGCWPIKAKPKPLSSCFNLLTFAGSEPTAAVLALEASAERGEKAKPS